MMSGTRLAIGAVVGSVGLISVGLGDAGLLVDAGLGVGAGPLPRSIGTTTNQATSATATTITTTTTAMMAPR